MPSLLVVGGGLFGSMAAAYARVKGIEATVFDAGLPGSASPAAAGLFKEDWMRRKWRRHFHDALPVLERLYGIRRITLADDLGRQEGFFFIPPAAILEPSPIHQEVAHIGDGWLEVADRRYEGYVYIAAGVWCQKFLPGLELYGKAGASYLFPGEREGRIRQADGAHQPIAFVRDAGSTYFSDGTAEREYREVHDQQTLERAAAMGLFSKPSKRFWGVRPYTPGNPIFQQIHGRTWLATGGRKLGVVLGAAFARRLIEEELR